MIYGSWARRYAGEPGAAPADIDLMVIGVPDVRDIQQRADRASPNTHNLELHPWYSW